MLLFACIALLCACDSSVSKSPENNLHIHLQGGFNQTPVQVLLNGELVYDEIVTTDNALGLAGGASFLTQSRLHMVEVRVAHDLLWQEVLITRSPLYLGVNFREDTNEIRVEKSRRPYLYD